MSHSRDEPPTTWLGDGVVKVSDDIYYRWPEDGANPVFWHWCTATGHWFGQGTGAHELIARDPLHLEPSLLWTCCNLHGWVRDGKWSSA